MKKEFSIYIHIPFCSSKCSYCDFYSIINSDENQDLYFEALYKEIKEKSVEMKDYIVRTIFIGGGTPSCVNIKYIFNLMEIIYSHFEIEKNAEISIESNPGNINKEKVDRYLESGINRLSIGLQTHDDRLLKYIGRIHTYNDFKNSLIMAREGGFKNINVDIMFGISTQTLEQVLETIYRLVSLGVDHISTYSLKVEEGTLFYNQLQKGEIFEIDEEIDREMYWKTNNFLSSVGYKHYEISNYAKEGFISKHNLVYWTIGEYIGFGCNSHSNLENYRYSNIKSLKEYVKDVRENRYSKVDLKYIDQTEKMSEYLILGLRLINGINKEDFHLKFGSSIDSLFEDKLFKLLSKGLIHIDETKIKLTKKGIDLSNQVFVEFI